MEEKLVGPLTPTEPVNGETKTVKSTIDVQGGETTNSLPVRELSDLKKTDTPPPNSKLSGTPIESTKQISKRGRKKAGEEAKPYEGLFEATLKMSDGPTVWEVRDLRENVKGGEKTWTEKAECLVCGTAIE